MVVHDENLRNLLRTVIFPIFLYLFYNVFSKQQENQSFNIDTRIRTDIEDGEIIWSSECKDGKYCFLKIINIGKVDIFKVYIKVKTYSGEMGYYCVSEYLFSDQYLWGKIPYLPDDIEKITISYSVRVEHKTKEFYGEHCAYESEIIFSQVSNKDREKDAIIHDKGIKEIISLKRKYNFKKSMGSVTVAK